VARPAMSPLRSAKTLGRRVSRGQTPQVEVENLLGHLLARPAHDLVIEARTQFMSGDTGGRPSGEVLDYLREQFSRVNAKLDLLSGDMTNLKVRVSGLEAEAGHVRIGLAEVNHRLDRMDGRLDRIGRRFDLAEAPPSV
jgi:hypothetical protein